MQRSTAVIIPSVCLSHHVTDRQTDRQNYYSNRTLHSILTKRIILRHEVVTIRMIGFGPVRFIRKFGQRKPERRHQTTVG